MERMAVFIDSFDGNSDVWDAFFAIHNALWGDCKYKRYLITNEKEYVTDNLDVIKTGSEKNWFVMTIKGLEQIGQKYVFFVLEDELIGQKINNEDIEEILDGMEKEDLFYYRMTAPAHFPTGKPFIKVPEDTPYPISLQPAIWNRAEFIRILNELYASGCRSPWDFERHFIEKYRNGQAEHIIPGIRFDSRNIMCYKNLIIQGKWDPRAVKYFYDHGIPIQTGDRPFMSKKAVLLDKLKSNKLIRSLSVKNQMRIKKVMKKLGIDFIT